MISTLLYVHTSNILNNSSALCHVVPFDYMAGQSSHSPLVHFVQVTANLLIPSALSAVKHVPSCDLRPQWFPQGELSRHLSFLRID